MLIESSAIVVHRARLQQLLVQVATEAGVVIKTNTRVIDIDESEDSPVAITKEGQRIEADLIIGADGKPSNTCMPTLLTYDQEQNQH